MTRQRSHQPTPVVGRAVPDDVIRNSLCLYKPEFMHVDNASYTSSTLWATFGLYELDFHRRPLQHLSRVQILHYVGQGAFVLAACMINEGLLPPLTQDEYYRSLNDERCTFRHVELRFREYLPNASGTRLMIRCHRLRHARSHWLSDLRFALNDGACVGLAHGILPAASEAAGDCEPNG